MVEHVDKRRQQEFDDLQNELADRDTGRARRFLPESHRRHEQQRKRDEQARMTRLAMMLADPAYSAAYEEAGLAISRAQTAADHALLRTADAIERLAEQLEELERRASRLNDQAVFRGGDGRYRRADGSVLNDAEAALIEHADNAPSYERYIQNVEALRGAQERRGRILEIQSDVIDPARERHQDQDNPGTLDELNAITSSMNDVTQELDEGVTARFAAAAAPSQEDPEPVRTNVPVLDIPALR